jgi:hypothetical protein
MVIECLAIQRLVQSDPQVSGYPLRGLAALMHGCHYQVRATHHVATGEDFRIARLVRARPK